MSGQYVMLIWYGYKNLAEVKFGTVIVRSMSVYTSNSASSKWCEYSERFVHRFYRLSKWRYVIHAYMLKTVFANYNILVCSLCDYSKQKLCVSLSKHLEQLYSSRCNLLMVNMTWLCKVFFEVINVDIDCLLLNATKTWLITYL